MKRMTILGLALLAGACHGGKTVSHEISAVITADPAAGTASLNCRSSSTGECHVLFVTGEAIQRIQAKAGATADATGVGDATQYCLQGTAPENGCRLRKLVKGEQIVRESATYREE